MTLKIYKTESPRNGLYISAVGGREMRDPLLDSREIRHFCLPLDFKSRLL